MRLSSLLASTLLLAAPLAPAAATNFSFGSGGATTNAASYAFTAGGHTLTARGYGYTSAPVDAAGKLMNAVGQAGGTSYTVRSVQRTGPGLGVVSPGDAANQQNQVDSDGLNEVLVLSIDSGLFRLTGGTFSRIDDNDTLRLYGLTAANTLVNIGFGGLFDGPGNATAFTAGPGGATAAGSRVSGSGEDQVYNVNFAGIGAYKAIYFLTNNESADGFRLNGVSIAAVPEPATWGMMLLGFGLIGAAARRRPVARMVAA